MIARVRPGSELVFASFLRLSHEFRKELFPTLLLPMTAISTLELFLIWVIVLNDPRKLGDKRFVCFNKFCLKVCVIFFNDIKSSLVSFSKKSISFLKNSGNCGTI